MLTTLYLSDIDTKHLKQQWKFDMQHVLSCYSPRNVFGFLCAHLLFKTSVTSESFRITGTCFANSCVRCFSFSKPLTLVTTEGCKAVL